MLRRRECPDCGEDLLFGIFDDDEEEICCDACPWCGTFEESLPEGGGEE